MKRMILLALGVVGLSLAGYCGTRVTAQPAAATGPTRVAVVNIGMVFSKYEKAKNFKNELEGAIKPFKDQAEKHRKDILAFDEAIKTGKYAQGYKKEDYDRGILDRKRKLEDLDREVRALVGKKQEDQLVQLWREVNEKIQAYALSNGFHVVMGYGDPMTAEELASFPNINRKMQGMDVGAAVPLFVAPGLDVSNDVVRALNDAYQRTGGQVTPASATAPAPKN